MNAAFQDIVEQMEPRLEMLKNCSPYAWGNLQGIPQMGVYAFYENGEAIYVGRSNRMRQRIREHGADGSRHESATFAFKLLREAVRNPESHQSGKSKTRKELQELYPREYKEQRLRIRNMTVRVVEIECQRVQAVFETYAILALGTTLYNTFHTT